MPYEIELNQNFQQRSGIQRTIRTVRVDTLEEMRTFISDFMSDWVFSQAMIGTDDTSFEGDENGEVVIDYASFLSGAAYDVISFLARALEILNLGFASRMSFVLDLAITVRQLDVN